MRRNQVLSIIIGIITIISLVHPSKMYAQQVVTSQALSPGNASKTNTVAKAGTYPLLTDVQQIVDSLRISGQKHIHKSNLYYKLAIAFAKMKMYPLALRCFYRSTKRIRNAHNETDSTVRNSFDLEAQLSKINEKIFQDSSGKAIALFGDTILMNNVIAKGKSNVVKGEDILKPFDDEKESSAYGIIVHVKQPVRGKRKKIRLFHGDVGHTFITLIKYNNDGSNVVRTFGFYPHKSLPLAATPLFPGTAADFKNDALHDWDESVGKFITKEQFDLIIDLTRKYTRKRYHLSKNNCTDFGLNIASIAGIYIRDTKGKWLLGKGNDPADMGQSIAEDKVTTSSGSLFICVENQ